jgi:CRP-like cAMP-binding protein
MRAGQLIIAAGSESTEAYLVLSGQVHVTLFAPSGREVSIRNIGTGELFGELAAIDGGMRSATVVAASEGQLAIVSAADFRRVIADIPEFSLWLMRRLAAQIRSLTERIFELSALPVRGRLQCELLRLAGSGKRSGDAIVIQPAPTHAELAARIGSQREVVTREFAYLTDLNIIQQDRRKLMLVDLNGLVGELRRSTGEAALAASNGTPS